MNDDIHNLDLNKLSEYLAHQLPDFSGINTSKKFGDGQSNPTYLIETPEKKVIHFKMSKKWFKKLNNNA